MYPPRFLEVISQNTYSSGEQLFVLSRVNIANVSSQRVLLFYWYCDFNGGRFLLLSVRILTLQMCWGGGFWAPPPPLSTLPSTSPGRAHCIVTQIKCNIRHKHHKYYACVFWRTNVELRAKKKQNKTKHNTNNIQNNIAGIGVGIQLRFVENNIMLKPIE